MKLILLITALLAAAVYVQGSANGGYYECDTSILTSESLCKFTYTSDAPSTWQSDFVGAVSNRITLTGNKNNRCLKDLHATVPPANTELYTDETRPCMSYSVKPWDDGTTVATTTDTITGYDWTFLLAFEMAYRIRDAFMYNPESVQTEEGFNDINKVYIDCWIKDVEEDHGTVITKSQETIKPYITETSADVHNYILQYVEEGNVDIACLMTDLEMTDKRCEDIRSKNGIKLGELSSCWIPAYVAIYGSDTTDTTNTDAIHGYSTSTVSEFIGSRWTTRLHETGTSTFSITTDRAAEPLTCIAATTGMESPSAANIEAGLELLDDGVSTQAAQEVVTGNTEAGVPYEFSFTTLTAATDYDVYCAFDGVRTYLMTFNSDGDGTGCASGECDMNDIWDRATAAGIDISGFPHVTAGGN